MALRGRIGGFVKASRYPPDLLTRAARQAFLARFERDVDPHNVLSPDERKRRAEAARRAHMGRLALLSAKKRARQARRNKEEAANVSMLDGEVSA